MARIEVNAVLTKDYTYTAKSYGYGYEDRYIYTFSGEDGKTYVWKTTSVLGLEKEVDGYIEFTPIRNRAVSEDNAYKRACKEYPGHEWKCIKIYDYQSAYC